jgi:molecular chaperone GrpE
MTDEVRNAAPPVDQDGADSPQEQVEPTPSVPAGEPEAPVSPATPERPATPEPTRETEPAPETEGEAAPGQDAPGQDGRSDDHEARLEHDVNELSAKAQKAEEYLELAQRTKADFENYRKRAAREAGAAQERGVIKLARELLPAVDNLDRALEAVDSDVAGGDLLAGIKLVHAEVMAALARVGVEPFNPTGEAFDPSCQEAVAQQPVEGAEAGTVAEVYQRGYRLGEVVIRPARVLVAG